MGRIIAGVYICLIFVFAIYGNWWGDFAYKGFAFNLGRSILWPTIIFPSIGNAIGVVVLLCVIGLLMLRRR